MTEAGMIHTAAAVVAMGAGAATLLQRKGTRSHRFLGHMYVWSMVALNATAFMLDELWGGFGPFHAAALVSLLTIVAGTVPVLTRKPSGRWLEHHAMWMAWSYAGLIAAFASEVATRVPEAPFGPAVFVATGAVIAVAAWLINGNGQRRVRSAMRKIPRTTGVEAATPAAVLALALSAGLPAGVLGQALPPAPEEMGAVAWLEGEWSGGGWIEARPGQRAEFEGSERVERRMGGRLLVVEGEFTAWMGPEVGDVPVHQALGVMSYDVEGDRYLFRTYTARGGQGEAHPAEVGDGRIVWEYDDPATGRVRYTITRTADGVWREVGEASRDGGESWYRFFEMELERVGDG